MDETADQLFESAKALVDDGNHEEAIAKLRQAVQREPNSPIYYAWLAKAYNDVGNWAEALDAAKRGIELDASCAPALRQRGYACAEEGKHLDAIAALTTALELEPDHKDALWWRAWAYAQLGDHQHALADRARLYELTPKKAYGVADPKRHKYFSRWLETIHGHFQNELLARVQSSQGERFVEYWPCYLLWDSGIETSWSDGTSFKHYHGSAGTGYLCLTTRNVYLASFGQLTQMYSATKGMGLGGGFRALLAREISHVRKEKTDKLWVVPNRQITTIQLVEGHVELQSHSGSWQIFSFFGHETERIRGYIAAAAGAFAGQPELPADTGIPLTSEADPVRLLRQLGELRAAGVLTEEEFEAKKNELLARL